MLGALEASTALYLYTAEPSMTATSSRETQRREQLIASEMWRRALARRASVEFEFPEIGTVSEQPTSANTFSTGPSIPSEEPKTVADRAIAQLLGFEHLDSDWDGNHAAKPLAFSIKAARQFIRALAPESVVPRPALHADGHAILFIRGADSYAELEFLGGRRIGYYARRGGQEWSDEFDFDGHTIPAGLSQTGFTT
jgi:hypothetical protein